VPLLAGDPVRPIGEPEVEVIASYDTKEIPKLSRAYRVNFLFMEIDLALER
jgi:hypothetical protein